jgi:alkyl hydroperoxide reductase subunit AhpC
LKGKWVLLYFWGFDCAPCLRSGLPKMAKFYDDHADRRDRFEIVSICIDDDGRLKSMVDVDRKLEPIVKHIWGGKTLPFPIVLDASFQTLESFGVSTMGTVLLIDPDGHLVRGDETVFAEKLK